MELVIAIICVAAVVFVIMTIRLAIAWVAYSQLIGRGYDCKTAAKMTKQIKFGIRKE